MFSEYLAWTLHVVSWGVTITIDVTLGSHLDNLLLNIYMNDIRHVIQTGFLFRVDELKLCTIVSYDEDAG